MAHDTRLLKRLTAIAEELASIALQLNGGVQKQPDFPADARKKFEAGQCLGGCGRTRETHTFRQGNCPSCNRKIKETIAELGPVAEFMLIESGKMAPLNYDPNPTELDRTLGQIQEAARQGFVASTKADADLQADAAAKRLMGKRTKKGGSKS